MIAVEECVLILLAAGRSRRFGDADKLQEPFLGKPLAYHVVTALEDVPFRARFGMFGHRARFRQPGICRAPQSQS